MLKIKLQQGQQIWFTSDTHFNHLNICRATTKWRKKVTIDGGEVVEVRPNNTRNFKSLDHMDDTIVNNINNVVAPNDILFHLGDFSFNGFENIEKFRNRINCKNVYIVCGNHDHHIVNNRDNIRSIFSDVFETRVELEVVTFHGVKRNMVLDHFPICSWNRMAKGWYLLHGHVHLAPAQRLGQGKSLDVGVDGNNYKPYSLTEVVSMLQDQPIAPLAIPSDHHTETFIENAEEDDKN